jgi:hypothetical protein
MDSLLRVTMIVWAAAAVLCVVSNGVLVGLIRRDGVRLSAAGVGHVLLMNGLSWLSAAIAGLGLYWGLLIPVLAEALMLIVSNGHPARLLPAYCRADGLEWQPERGTFLWRVRTQPTLKQQAAVFFGTLFVLAVLFGVVALFMMIY